MSRRRTIGRAAPRRLTYRANDGVSTALLLPDLHPWLKEFFAMHNLIPIRDEEWLALPRWEPLIPPQPATSHHACVVEVLTDAGLLPPPVVPEGKKMSSREPMPLARHEYRQDDLEVLDAAFHAIAIAPDNPKAGSPISERSERPSGAAVGPSIHGRRALLAMDAGLQGWNSCGGIPLLRNEGANERPHAEGKVYCGKPEGFLQPGVRRSSAPVPFTIRLQETPAPEPSRHVLRIARPTPVVRAYPNLLSEVRAAVAPAHTRAQRLRPIVAAWYSERRDRARALAPLPHISAPYDELLVVTLLLPPILALWRRVGWPLWAFSHLPHPRALYGAIGARIHNAIAPMSYTFATQPIGLPAHRLRHAFAFALVLGLVIFPVKFLGSASGIREARGQVLGATASAIGTFQAGGDAAARASFIEAAATFGAARDALDGIPDAAGVTSRIGSAIAGRLPIQIGGSIGRMERVRRAAVRLADASSVTARGLAELQTVNFRTADAAALLHAAQGAFASARLLATSADADLRLVAPNLHTPVARAITELERAESLLSVIRALAGLEHAERILLVFQNPAELRPTGGFIGAIALLDVRNGQVESLELPGGGSYDVSGVSHARVLPPEPLRLLSPTWQFHDANWFPDFPTSARKLRWFYSASGGPSVDAVVAVNAPVLADILALTGPIAAGDRTLTATDVLTILTDTVEDPRARATGKPKAILATLAPELLQRLLAITASDDRARLAVLDRFLRALDERDILLAFTDDAAQRSVLAMGWGGEIRPAPRDALLVVHTNIGGGKSDARMREDIAHHATILDDGSIVDTVAITRAHVGGLDDRATPSERLASLANVEYLRVYVPRGAELLAAEGFAPPPADAFDPAPADALPDRDLLATELGDTLHPIGLRVTEEFGRTVFGGWVQTPPGTLRTVRVTYRLPWRYDTTTPDAFGRTKPAGPQPYTVRFEKQSGTRPTLQHTITVSPNWHATWTAENIRPSGSGSWTFADILTTDRFTGVMISPR